MNEKPIERLNYYNGQRLEADDLKLEQEYHIRVRRWLNKSLYSAGIAHGLEVRPQLNDKGQSTSSVIVSPGMSLDFEGREIILLEEQFLPVVGKSSKTEGQVDGNYLTIQYREETRAEESDSCTPRGKGRNKGQLAWGGPSRVRATPVLGWSDVFPHESSGKIVLAQVELDSSCNVRHVYAYPRRYVGPTSLTTVRQFALEGERHIDSTNSGRIYFHIRGRQPNAVTLYLRAEKFSTLYYTELGKHKHSADVTNASATDKASTIDNHSHAEGTLSMASQTPQYSVNGFISSYENVEGLFSFPPSLPFQYPEGPKNIGNPNPDMKKYMLRVITAVHIDTPVLQARAKQENLSDMVGIKVIETEHAHSTSISGKTANTPSDPAVELHTHPIQSTTASITDAGVSDFSARSEPDPKKPQPNALTYVNNLQVYIGKVDQTGVVPMPLPDMDNHTKEILTQLNNAQPTVAWLDTNGHGSLGDGRESHPLAHLGTGEIRLDLLSPNLSFPDGQYYIELRAPDTHPDTGAPISNNGGRILYNLYVE